MQIPHTSWLSCLKWLHLQAFRFQGGKLIRIGHEPDEGIQFLGKDFVSVRREDQLYLVPYGSLVAARGTRRKIPNRIETVSLRQELVQWIDPESTLWHYFISREGRLFKGAVVGINAKGIRLRPLGHRRTLTLPWSHLGAAVEILE